MAEYELDKTQKELLRLLVPYLKDRDSELKRRWGLAHTFKRLHIFGMPDELLEAGWKDAKSSDFDDFVRCGLFDFRGNGRKGKTPQYSLNAQAIIQAIENDFQIPEGPALKSVQMGDVHGNVNIAGRDINITTLTNRLEQLIKDCETKIEESEEQYHAQYWRGARFGFETVIAELRQLLEDSDKS